MQRGTSHRTLCGRKRDNRSVANQVKIMILYPNMHDGYTFQRIEYSASIKLNSTTPKSLCEARLSPHEEHVDLYNDSAKKRMRPHKLRRLKSRFPSRTGDKQGDSSWQQTTCDHVAQLRLLVPATPQRSHTSFDAKQIVESLNRSKTRIASPL